LFIAYVEGLARRLTRDRHGLEELQRTFASLEKVLGKIFQTYAPERDVLGYFGAMNALLGEARNRAAQISVQERREL